MFVHGCLVFVNLVGMCLGCNYIVDIFNAFICIIFCVAAHIIDVFVRLSIMMMCV